MSQPLRSSMMFGSMLLVAFSVAGCGQEMANQPRVDTMEPSHFEFATIANRTPVPGTVARGRNFDQTPEQTGFDNGEVVARIPVPVTEALLARGQDRFNAFCQHCHGPSGSGDGLVVQRGFPAPPDYHVERLMQFSDGQLFLTISNGVSRMPSFRKRIPVEDRWAIVSYIRALQMSQNIPADSLTAEERQKLDQPSESAHQAH